VNSWGSVAGIVGNMVTGIILDSWTGEGWQIVLGLMAIIYVLATLVFVVFAKTDVLFE